MSYSLNQKRARKGARLLDAEYPNWADRIHIDGLQMSSATRCVLGHVYENYFDGLAELFGNRDSDEDYHFGFTLPPDDDASYPERNQAWESLGQAWEPLIRARQSA